MIRFLRFLPLLETFGTGSALLIAMEKEYKHIDCPLCGDYFLVTDDEITYCPACGKRFQSEENPIPLDENIYTRD